jgi:transposase-like protein
MILNNSEEDGTCPKCKEELEWVSGSTMEYEKWYCEECNSLYEVQCELVRFWDTLEEVDE